MNLWPKNRRIFLDFASATPVLPEVKREMEKYWSHDFYNPSSLYKEGERMKRDLGERRARVARALGVRKSGIVFTSGATESDNLAIFGSYEAFREKFPHKAGHLIVSSIEHPAVLEAARELQRRGARLSLAPVDESGLVSLEEIEKLIREDTFLVSVSLANGEIGTIQPIAKIGRLIKKKRKELDSLFPYFHTDASQAFGQLKVNLESLNADLLTLESAKIYGPKGAGLLAVRGGVQLRPLIWGGKQEFGLRSGTESLALIAGLDKALQIAESEREKEFLRLLSLREYFAAEIKKNIPEALINGPEREVLPSIVSVSIPGILSEMLLLALDKDGVAVSVGSACSSNSDQSGSDVLRAIGKPDLAESTIRFSFGRKTDKKDLESALEILYRRVAHGLPFHLSR